MIFNKMMDWKDHTGLVCDKVYKGLRSAWSLFNDTSQLPRILMAKSLFLPHFEYCSVVHIQTVQSFCIDHKISIWYTEVRQYQKICLQLLGFSLKNFYSFRAFAFLHRLINSNSPKYLNLIVKLGSSTRTKQLWTPRYNN